MAPPRNSFIRAEQALRSIELARHLTLEALMTRVAKYRGRKIVINEMAELIGSKACGLWLSTDETEFVFHAPTKSALHRQQCILHELAHMVLRHDETVVSVEYAPTLFPDLSGERVRSALARSDFLREEEITAELLADLFAKAIHDSTQEPQNFEGVFG